MAVLCVQILCSVFAMENEPVCACTVVQCTVYTELNVIVVVSREAGSIVMKKLRSTHQYHCMTRFGNAISFGSKAFFLVGRCSCSCIQLSIQPKNLWQSSSWFCALNTRLVNSLVASSSLSWLLPARRRKKKKRKNEIQQTSLRSLCVVFYINSKSDEAVLFFLVRYCSSVCVQFDFTVTKAQLFPSAVTLICFSIRNKNRI